MKFKNENERGRIRRSDIIRKGSDRKDVKEREGEEVREEERINKQMVYSHSHHNFPLIWLLLNSKMQPLSAKTHALSKMN